MNLFKKGKTYPTRGGYMLKVMSEHNPESPDEYTFYGISDVDIPGADMPRAFEKFWMYPNGHFSDPNETHELDMIADPLVVPFSHETVEAVL